MRRFWVKAMHAAVAGGVWLWAAAMAGLWARPFDGSSVSLWLALSAAWAALAVGLWMPGQILRGFQRVLGWLRPRTAPAIPAPQAALAEAPRWLRRCWGSA